MSSKKIYYPSIDDIKTASLKLEGVVTHTPLIKNLNLSEKYKANIYLKREDLQSVRSYKLRGAYNKISSLDSEALKNGVVCASAGNHAQGVAYSCRMMKIKGTIFMPVPTPKQKIKQVKMFGKEFIDIELIGDTFDDAQKEAMKYCRKQGLTFIHPFDDEKVIEGQGTVALEILEDIKEPIDYLIIPVGGGGLASGAGAVFKALSPDTKIIGVEPSGAASMKTAIDRGEVVTLETIDKFVDGAAVQRVGEKTFEICRSVLDRIVITDEGKVCTTILELYNEDALVVEPAGALSITALDLLKDEIKGKTVVSIVSGSNNDIVRMEEIKERSLLYEGFKHYFIVRFPQRAGALKKFVNKVLGPNDDITYFQYQKKIAREKGPAVVGIELRFLEDYKPLLERMDKYGFVYEYINDKPDLFQYLI